MLCYWLTCIYKGIKEFRFTAPCQLSLKGDHTFETEKKGKEINRQEKNERKQIKRGEKRESIKALFMKMNERKYTKWLMGFVNPLTPNDRYGGRTAPLTSKVAFHICIQQIYVLNILNMVYTLPFFPPSKCSLFHNSNVFGSCIIHILYTVCAKIKKKIIPAPKVQRTKNGS